MGQPNDITRPAIDWMQFTVAGADIDFLHVSNFGPGSVVTRIMALSDCTLVLTSALGSDRTADFKAGVLEPIQATGMKFTGSTAAAKFKAYKAG
jgi:hypothetical protein